MKLTITVTEIPCSDSLNVRLGSLTASNTTVTIFLARPVPVAARSKAWVYGHSLAETVGSNPTGGTHVCFECCVLSGRGLCDELITCPGESYRLWCAVV